MNYKKIYEVFFKSIFKNFKFRKRLVFYKKNSVQESHDQIILYI